MTRQRYILKQIKPEDIDFSDFNPRGEKPDEVEKDPAFEQLKDSVYRYGVLVPVVVHPNGAGSTRPYRLVDGERRLRAALATKAPLIPAHIASEDEAIDDLVKAFHIHMLRKQWSAVAQAKALKQIMEGLKESGKPARTTELLEQLKEATGCSETRLKALRRAIRFPQSVLKAVEEGRLRFSYLVQIEESFMEAVHQKFPDLLTEIGERHARQVLVAKAQQKTLTSARALLENVAPVITRASDEPQRSYAKQLLKEFIEKEGMPAEQVRQRYEAKFPVSENWAEVGEEVIEAADYLVSLLGWIDTEMVKGHPQLTKKVHQHLTTLRGKLTAAIRRTNRVAA